MQRRIVGSSCPTVYAQESSLKSEGVGGLEFRPVSWLMMFREK